MDDKAILSLLDAAQKVVFWCSFGTIILSVIERWMQKWYPNHARPFSAFVDLISQFGALNLRDRIAPKQPPVEKQAEEQK